MMVVIPAVAVIGFPSASTKWLFTWSTHVGSLVLLFPSSRFHFAQQ